MSHRPAHHARLRWAGLEDTPALQDLFRRAFGADTAEAEWRWKYASGDGFSLMAEHGGRAMAHYGGQSRGMHGLGTECKAIQVSDIMVDPAARGTLGRNGL